MSVETILVFGEGDESGPSGLTLELLAAARELAANVEVFVAGDGAAMAAELGSHGASKVYSTGLLDGKLMGVHAAATLQSHLESNSVDAIFFGQTPDGRDTAARLAVRLDEPVVTNNVGASVEDGVLVVEEPVFGGTQNVFTAFRNDGPALALFRPKSFEAEAIFKGSAYQDRHGYSQIVKIPEKICDYTAVDGGKNLPLMDRCDRKQVFRRRQQPCGH